jgi:hypothetical protein
VNFSTIKSGNGQVNVFLNGEKPLVVGANDYAHSADFSSPQTAILDSQGNNAASEITGGKLAAY